VSDQIEVELNALLDVVQAMGAIGYSLSERVFDSATYVINVKYLGAPAATALNDVEHAVSSLQRASRSMQDLQKEVGDRGRLIAQIENRPELVDSFTKAARPRTYTSTDDLHQVLSVFGLIPTLIGSVSNLVNAGVYAWHGQFGNALVAGLGAIPGEKLVGKAFSWGMDLFRDARALKAFAEISHLNPADLSLSEQETLDAYLRSKYETYLQKPSRNGTPKLSFERWLQTGGNGAKAAKMMDRYRAELGWGQREYTPSGGTTNRRFDIAEERNPTFKRAIEHKTGYQTLTPQNLAEIERDKQLIAEGWNLVWAFVNGRGSKPLQDELARAGIPWVVEPHDLPPPRP